MPSCGTGGLPAGLGGCGGGRHRLSRAKIERRVSLTPYQQPDMLKMGKLSRPLAQSLLTGLLWGFANSGWCLFDHSPPVWRYCESDNQCLWVDSACGEPDAVNKKYLQEYLDDRGKEQRLIQCASGEYSQQNKSAYLQTKKHVICSRHTCKIEPIYMLFWRAN